MQLHDTLSETVCHRYRHIFRFDKLLFADPGPPPCISCKTENEARAAQNLRPREAGWLRLNVLLYGEHNSAEEEVGELITHDIEEKLGLLLVVDTSMSVPAVRKLVKDFAKSTSPSGITAWLKDDPPKSTCINLYNVVVVGYCQAFARDINTSSSPQ